MSEILARIRVRETHGIRRFLYQSVATLELPSDADSSQFQFFMADGEPIPTEVRSAVPDYMVKEGRRTFQIHFAVSLAPFEDIQLDLHCDPPYRQVLDDPLDIQRTEDGGIENRQKRFFVSLAKSGAISQVVYDGVPHLKESDRIELNGCVTPDGMPNHIAGSHLALHYSTSGLFPWDAIGERDRNDFLSITSLTACKSWITRHLWIQDAKPQDKIVFTLPLAITSPTLTCDFGVGGYVFGKLDAKAPEIVWRTEVGDAPHARWIVATAGRTDYVGEVATAEEFRPQRWFHLIDSDKAVAAIIHYAPPECKELKVRLTHDGNVSIAFELGDTMSGPAEFVVTYHFLNDVPAIAAATNPQSILLPPTVEVLPV